MIEELIDLARSMRTANERGEGLGLGKDELAFYDALETSDSAVQVLGDEKLRLIAWELVRTVRNNVSIDWTRREERKSQAARRCKAHPEQVRLSAGQALRRRRKRCWSRRKCCQRLGRGTATGAGLPAIPETPCGDGVVTNELIDRLREETGD